MVPLVACAISVSNALPEAWLNNQAYQKVTAMVGSASIGLDPKYGITKKRDMPDGNPDGHPHGGRQWCPGGLQLGLCPASEARLLRELRVEGVDHVDGNRHRQAVPNIELGDVRDGCAKGDVQAY